MKKHIYVLGANSFSGSHFIKKALENGCRVTGISRSRQPHPVFLAYKSLSSDILGNFTFLQADINHDLDALLGKMENDRPEYIVNFAAQGMVAESWNNPCQWLRTNALSLLGLINGLKNSTWLQKFVQISTPEVYGATNGIIKENLIYNPSTPYAVSKASADMNLMAYFKAYGFPAVFTRAANVYGPGQLLHRIIPKTAMCFLSGKKIELHGGGASVRSFIHIEDVANATMKIMAESKPGNIYHISCDNAISIKELVLLMASFMNVNPLEHIINTGERLGKDSHYLLDSSTLKNEFNWKAEHSLEDGLREVIAWAKDNYGVLSAMPLAYIHKE